MAKKRAFKMPSAVTIVMIFLAVVAVLTWFVPTSAVVTDGDPEVYGGPVADCLSVDL